jgi:uncharacterized repeat protein (TIGR01451 family)
VLQVTNLGPSYADNLVVQDMLPAGISNPEFSLNLGNTWQTWTGTYTAPTFNFPGSLTILIRGTVNSSATGTLVNTATVDSDTDDPDPDNNEDMTTTDIEVLADLIIFKTELEAPVSINGPIEYIITVFNAGPSDATNSIITDAIDPAVIGTPEYSLNGGMTWFPWTGSLNVGTIIVGSTLELHIRGTVLDNSPDPNVDPIPNTASVASDVPDPVPGNNTVTINTPLFIAVDLEIIKTGPATIIAGTQIVYDIQVTNLNNTFPADAVVVIDFIDPLTIQSQEYSLDGMTWLPWTGSINFGIMDPLEVITFQIRGNVVPTATGSILNNAQVNTDTPDTNLANNVDDVTTTILQLADLAITKVQIDPTQLPTIVPANPKEVFAGQKIHYALTITNLGPSTATSVLVEDVLPAGILNAEASICGSSYAAWSGSTTLSSLIPSGTCIILIRGDVDPVATGTLLNVATVSSPIDDPDPDNNEDDEETEILNVADLFISKIGTPATLKPGDTLTYTITVINFGISAAVNAVVSDIIPAGLTFIDAVPSVGTWSAPTWSLGTMQPLASATLVIRTIVQELQNASTIVNTAVVDSDTDDPDPTNNTSTTTTTISANPQITLVKEITSGATYDEAGDVIEYSFTVTNTGNVTISQPISVDDNRIGMLTNCIPGPLAPGQSAVCTASYIVTQADVDAGSVLNIATASTTFAGAPVTSGPDDATALAIQNPELTITKSSVPAVSYNTVGQLITYTLAVENTGNITIDNIVVTDPFVATGPTYVSGDTGSDGIMLPGEIWFYTATYTIQPIDRTNATISNIASVTGEDPDDDPVTDQSNEVTLYGLFVDDDAYTTPFNTPVNGDVSLNDDFPAGSDLSLVSSPANGSVVLAEDGNFIYTPNNGFTGVDVFTYEVCLPAPNGTVCDTATVTIVVGPDAVDDSYVTPFETPVVGASVAGNDTYPPTSTFGVVTNPPVGVLDFNPDGTFDYSPPLGFSGVVTYTYNVCLPAPNGSICDTAVATIVVGPDAVDDQEIGTVNTPVVSDVNSNDVYPPGSAFSVVDGPNNGSIALIPDGNYIYTPDMDYTGRDTVVYSVCLPAPNGAVCDTATLVIIIGPDAVDDDFIIMFDEILTDNVNDNDLYPSNSSFSNTTTPQNGVLTFNNDGTFTYDPNPGFSGIDTFRYEVCLPAPDGTICDTALVTIAVGPFAEDDEYITPFETPVSGDVSDNDVYAPGSSFDKLTEPDNGTLVFSPDGTFIYTPDPGFTGTDTFTYHVCMPVPNETNCDTATVVLIIGLHAMDDSYVTPFNTPVTANASTNDTYPVNSGFAQITNPANGTVTAFNPATGVFTYEPDPGFTGIDTFSYQVCLPAPNGTVCDTALITIVIGPDAVNDSYTTPYETPVLGNVSANDIYPAGSVFDEVDGPDNGSIVFASNGSFIYTPDPGFTGIETFTYSVCLAAPNGTVCDTATVTIVVGPDAVDDLFSTPYDTDLLEVFSANDTYPPGSEFEIVIPPANAILTIYMDGTFDYDPNEFFSGLDTFSYSVCLPAPNGAICDTAIVVVVVGPDAVNDNYITPYETSVLGNVSSNDIYPIGSVFDDIDGPNNGSIVFASNGTFIYTPAPGFTGIDTFTYNVCLPSPNGTVCDTAIAVIVVGPDAVNDSYVTPFETPVMGDVSDNDDYPVGSVFAVATPLPMGVGTLTFNNDGTFEYEPAMDFTGVTSFTYTVCLPAPNGAVCDEATVTLVVGPEANDDSYTTPYETPVTANVNVNDEYPANSTFNQLTQPANGTVVFSPNGSFTYTPNPGFTGIDSYTYEVCLPAPNGAVCDPATVTIVVGPDAVDDSYVTPFETLVSGNVSTNDDYPANSTFAVVSAPGSGTLDFNPDGTFDYTPAMDFTGVVTFTYSVCLPAPNNTVCDIATVTIVVGPEANDDSYTTPYETPVTANVNVNDVYPANSTFNQLTQPANGTVVFSPNGSFTYTPDPGFTGIDSYTYEVCLPAPNGVVCDPATVTIVVGPDAVDDSYVTPFETLVSGNVSTNDDYPANSTFAVVSAPGSGTLDFNPDGTFDYTPAMDFTGVVTFTYSVCLPAPNNTVCDIATVTIVVGPEANDDSYTTPYETPVTANVNVNDEYPANSTFNQLTQPANGTVVFSPNGSFTYTPDPGFTGIDSYTYEVCLPAPNGAVCDPATVTIVVGPDAVDDLFTTPYNTDVNGTVVTNDIYPVGSDFSLVTNVPMGTGSLAFNMDGTFTFDPADGFSGIVTFTYDVCFNPCDTATVTIVVGPDAVDDAYTTPINVPVTDNVPVNDTFPPGSQFTVVTGPTNGGVVMASDGSFVYVPDPNFTGTDVFTYSVCLPAPYGYMCDIATVTITILPACEITCPPAITDVADAGECFAEITLTLPTLGTECDPASLRYSVLNPDGSISGPFDPAVNDSYEFEVGISQITWSVEDDLGSSVTCVQQVTVTEDEDPTITCPTNATINTNNLGNTGDCAGTYEWTHPLPADNCGVLQYNFQVERADGTTDGPFDLVPLLLGANQPPFDAAYDFPIGTSTVRYFVADASGNSVTCTFTVTVSDNEPPVFINCPNTTFTISTDENCSNEVIWSIPIANDNCEVVSVVETSTGGPFFSQPLTPGTYNIQYTATDASGLTATCNFTIEVVDDNAPLLVCLPDLTVSADAGVCTWESEAGELNPLLAVDNCPGFVLAHSINGGGFVNGFVPGGTIFPIGTSIVTYRLTDANNNTVTCSFEVTVEDGQAPVINSAFCGVTTTLNTQAGTCGNTQTRNLGLAVTDNCTGTLNLQYELVILDANGLLTTYNTRVITHTFQQGVNIATLTVTDAEGNTASCSAVFVVNDNQAPVITCASGSPFARNNTTGLCGYVTQGTEFNATATDNCGVVGLTHNYGAWGNPNSLAGATFPVGTTVVVWTAEDADGNTTTCSISVEVTDAQAPVFVNCPNTTFTISTDENCSNEVIWSIPVASDNCPGVTVAQTGGPALGSPLAPGTYNIQYTATDAANNTATCNFTIEVVDDNAPLLVCLPDLTVSADAGVCTWESEAGELNPLLAVDNCPGFVLAHSINGGGFVNGFVPGGTIFPSGTSIVTYRLTDANNNTVTCSFEVTVEDDEAPVIAGCDDLGLSLFGATTLPAAPGECTLTPPVLPYFITDNCSNELEADLIVTLPSGIIVTETVTQFVIFGIPTPIYFTSPTLELGVNTLQIVVRDEAGNVSSCTGQIIIIDTQDPVIDCPTVAASYANTPGLCGYVAQGTEFDATATDNCEVEVTHNYFAWGNPNSLEGATFPVGSTTVTWTATDPSGNTDVCQITIVVTDEEDPTFVNCPNTTFTISTDENCSNEVIWSIPVASDNCPGVTVAQTGGPALGSPLTPGTYNIQYTATDAAGLTATCNFTIEVVDDNAPLLVCPPSLTVGTSTDVCEWIMPINALNPLLAVDNCPGFVLEHSIDGDPFAPGVIPSETPFALGTTTVTYRLTDPAMNQVTCSFEVTVVDDEAPVIDGVVCNAAINTVVDAGLCTDNQTFDLSTSTDNCGVTGYEAVILNANGQFTNYNTSSFNHDFGVGVSVVTFTISDAAGNTSSCSLSVVVTDEQEPTVTCPANMDLVITNSDPDACGLVSDFTLPHPQDNCGISQFVYSIFLPDGSVAGPFDLTFVYSDPGLFGNSTTLSYFFPVGTSTINILGEDFNGNQVICSYTITVEDEQNPVFVNCPNTTFTISTDENCSNEVIWSIPIADDNCGIISVIETSSGGPFYGQPLDPDTYNIQYTATDIYGNTATCNFTIEVVDDNAPLLVCLPDLTVSADAGVCTWTSEAGELNPLLAVDNCPGFVLEHSINGGPFITGPVPVTIFALGTTSVTYRLTDPSNNVVTCSFDVTVVDDQAPVIDAALCNTSYMFDTDAGECTSEQSIDLSGFVSDNCSDVDDLTYQTVLIRPNGKIEVLNGNDIAYAMELGTTFAIFQITDEQGNLASCFASVIVMDNELPEIDCPVVDAFYANTNGICGYVAQGAEFDATGSDNCDIVSLTHNYGAWGNPNSLAGATFPVGTTEVVWTVVDGSGNSTQCTISIVVEDTENPVFVNCPTTTFTISTDANCSNEVIWSIPVADDNCGIASVVETSPGGPYYSQPLTPGTYLIQYTATDVYNNTAICIFRVVVVDDEAPLLVCLPDMTVGTDAGVCTWTSEAGELNPLLAVDNCPGFVLDHSINGEPYVTGPVPVTVFALGTTTVTYRLTDSFDNIVFCSFDVTVVDDEAPVIDGVICNAAINVETDADECVSNQAFDLSPSTDNCGITSYSSVVLNANGQFNTYTTASFDHDFGVGISIVTFTLTDAAGNTSSCSLSVVVMDEELPTISCPVGDPLMNDCPVDVQITNNSNCFEIVWDVAPAPLPGSLVYNSLTYNLISGDGTMGSPAIYRRVGAPPASCNAATSPFTGELTIGGETCYFSGGGQFSNTFTRENTDGICGYVAEGGEFNATGADNCGVASVSHNYGDWAVSDNLDGATFPVGTTSVTWTVVDLSGNSTQCTITIVVEDTENPVFVNCPNTTFTIGVDEDCESGIIWSIPIAEDNCDIASVVETSPGGPFYGQPLDPDTYEIQYTATDIYGNTATCNFTIIVEDDNDPLLVCPPNFTVGTDAGVCTWASTASTNPLLTVDNCPDYVLTYALSGATMGSGTGLVPANTIFNEGVTTVTYELEDGAGNTSVCSFTVTVADDEAPVIAAALCNETYNFDTDLVVCTSDQSMDIADFVSDNCSAMEILLT